MSSKRNQKRGSTGPATQQPAPSSNGPAPTASAWQRPLQPKTKPGPPPGLTNTPKQTSAPGAALKTAGAFSGLSMLNRDRFLSLSVALVGNKVSVTQTNGSVLEGVVHTYTPFHSQSMTADTRNKLVVKECRVTKQSGGSAAIKDGSTVILSADKVAYIHAVGVKIEPTRTPSSNGNAPSASYAPAARNNSALRTDTEISSGHSNRSNELVAAGNAWTSGGKSRADILAGALEDKPAGRKGFGTALGNGDSSGGLQGNIGQWDQFKANEKLFNVSATYDENLYTTELDKTRIDSRKIAEAERIAREIETTTSSNIHVAEERGLAIQGDFDEEDRYSGVLTQDGTQRHAAASSKPKVKATPLSATASVPAAGSDDKDRKELGSKSQAPKKMNYAAAAAKADVTAKAAPPSAAKSSSSASSTVKPLPLSSEEPIFTKTTTEDQATAEEPKQVTPTEISQANDGTEEKGVAVSEDAAKKSAPKVEEKKVAAESKAPQKDVKTEKSSEGKGGTKAVASSGTKLKLNPKAKSFSFNPSAKSFTPSFGATGAAQAPPGNQQPQPASMDQQPLNVHVVAGGAHMQAPQFMHSTMGQPGMVPMIAAPYGTIRYQTPYDQHQMQTPMPQHAQAVAGAPPTGALGAAAPPPTSGAASGNSVDNESTLSEGDASQQAAQQPQQQIPMPAYGVHPHPYFPGGIPMQRPGYPHFVSGPSVGPGGAPYRHMYPVQGSIPPNALVRPGGAPSFYAGPTPYSSGPYVGGMMDDGGDPSNMRGRGGRGGGAGRGRKGRGGRGRGSMGSHNGNNRNNYANHNSNANPSNNGRQKPQGGNGSAKDPNAKPLIQASGATE